MSNKRINSSFSLSNITSHSEGNYDKLQYLLKDNDTKQKKVEDAREILGEASEHLTDEQVNDLVTEVQYLVDTWLEEYERKVFNGKTLNEILVK